jgi:hypothetical protein
MTQLPHRLLFMKRDDVSGDRTKTQKGPQENNSQGTELDWEQVMGAIFQAGLENCYGLVTVVRTSCQALPFGAGMSVAVLYPHLHCLGWGLGQGSITYLFHSQVSV